MRLIDADYLLRRLYGGGIQIDRENANPHFVNGIMSAVEAINDAPTIDAEPVRHGHWITGQEPADDDGLYTRYFFECSCCGCVHWMKTNFCDHCGAKMDEEVPNG